MILTITICPFWLITKCLFLSFKLHQPKIMTRFPFDFSTYLSHTYNSSLQFSPFFFLVLIYNLKVCDPLLYFFLFSFFFFFHFFYTLVIRWSPTTFFFKNSKHMVVPYHLYYYYFFIFILKTIKDDTTNS